MSGLSHRIFPELNDRLSEKVVRFGERSLRFPELFSASALLASRIREFERVAIFASPSLETCIGVMGALMAGVPAVPLNPGTGTRELAHILEDSRPQAVVAAQDDQLPNDLCQVSRLDIGVGSAEHEVFPEIDPDSPALIFYTSGTTGPPKGVILPRRALSSNLDDLAHVWNWSSDDVLTHGLPLFHVHGLVLGVLGPLRIGCSLEHVVRSTPSAIAAAFNRGATMLFGVPTMYNALAEDAAVNIETASSLAGARLLISGSAPLPVPIVDRIKHATGQSIVERYGLTETLMNCAIWEGGKRRPGYVGPPLPHVDVMLVGDDGVSIEDTDDETLGEIAVRGPNLFLGYLNRPDATAKAIRDGWFFTGDLATRSEDGYFRILGRRETDLIKTGGFKIGAGEVEAALLEHPLVAEAAVRGMPDERLGEQVVAWVVLKKDSSRPSDQELADHVAQLLAAHKRPRVVNFVPELPRNAMGKIMKKALQPATGSS